MPEITEAGKSLIEVAGRLHNKKQNWDQLNQEIATWFYLPRQDFTQTLTLGDEFGDHIADATPLRALRDLGNAMGTMMRPSSQDWFKITMDEDRLKDDVAAQRKLESMTRVTRRALYAKDSNYVKSAKQADMDYAAFGCSVKSITNNRQRNGLVYQTWHLKDCAWTENEEGTVDQIYRKIEMSARGMEKQFGRDALPEAVKNSLDNNKSDKTHKLWHVCIPVDMYDPKKKFPNWAQFASVYVGEDGTILKEEPEHEFMYVVARWGTVAGWGYGYSPATMVGLPDARLIERMSVTIIEASEKSTDPPLVATTESIQGPVDITAGSITWIDAEYDERLGAAIRPLDLGKNAGIGYNLLDRRALELSQTFFLDKLTLPDTRERTAFEVSQLVQEYVRNALPIFEPMEQEVTGAELDLTVSKLMRLGAYGDDFPESLQGTDIEFEFMNPLREARDRQTLGKYQEAIGVIGQQAQFGEEALVEAVRNVNTKKMFRDAFSVAAPADWLLTEEEAQANDDAAADEAEQQKLIAQIQQGAQTAQEVAGAVEGFQKVTGEV